MNHRALAINIPNSSLTLLFQQRTVPFKKIVTMAQADQIFRSSFRKHFANHEANYPPTTPIAIGDFGEMQNGFFVRLGNIKNSFGLDYSILGDDDPTYEQFKSDASVEVNFRAKGDIAAGGIPVAKAQIELKFSSEKSFFFSSAEVRYLQMDNLFEIGQKLVALYDDDKWKKRFVLVSRILEGKNTVIVISGSSGASVTIEAETGEIPNMDLANAHAKIGFKSSSNLSYQIIAPGNIQIGFGLSRVYNPIFNKPVFKTRETMAHTFAKMDNSREVDKMGVVFGDVLLHDQSFA